MIVFITNFKAFSLMLKPTIFKGYTPTGFSTESHRKIKLQSQGHSISLDKSGQSSNTYSNLKKLEVPLSLVVQIIDFPS